MSGPLKREFRYERKFIVDQLDTRQVRLLVRQHPAMFHEPYPPRMVNNLYLDTEMMDNYQANVNGASERKKVRLRWYGKLWGDINCPVLEFKVKDGKVGSKYSYAFPGFSFEDGFSHRDLQDLVQSADLPENVRSYLRSLSAVLCNRYFRWYYASHDQHYRLTVDTGMVYYRMKRAGSYFKARSDDRQRTVVELKYAIQLDPQADRISSFFPFSMTRNSKYVTGIERVYL